MKHSSILLPILCFLYITGCSPRISQKKQHFEREFLYRTKLDTSKNGYGEHIEVKQVLPDTRDLIAMSLDDRDIIGRSKYSRDDRIRILGEYLTFRGDTVTSNKAYHFKAAYHMERPKGVNAFTVEIEALYSFTRMLTVGYPPIKPALINRLTGEQLNTNPKIIAEVYDLYIRWYNNNKKTNFKDLTLPLTGSPYCWLGEDKGMDPYLKRSL